MPLPVDRDSRIAALIFLFSFGVLACGAALGLNPWPGAEIFQALSAGSVSSTFVSLSGNAIAICVIFWGSRPSILAQRTVLLVWIFLSVVLWCWLTPEFQLGWFDSTLFPAVMFLAGTLSIPCSLALLIRLTKQKYSVSPDPQFEQRLRWLVVLTLLFIVTPRAALGLSATLHPVTFDLYALHWDHVAGISISPWLSSVIESIPGLAEVIWMAYGLTPLSFLAVAILHLRGRPAGVPSALPVWVLLTLLAVVAYNFFPIVGPRYIFGSDQFIAGIRGAEGLPLVTTMVPPNLPRNGMPSMHFGWMLAATILWWRSSTRWYSRALLLTLTVLTATATLFTGEHYVIDLVVAVPFVLAGIALATTQSRCSEKARWLIVGAGFSTWLAWVWALRLGMQYFMDYPFLCQVALALTALVVCAQIRWQAPTTGDAGLPTQELKQFVEVPPSSPCLGRSIKLQMGLMFFASGAAALVYQVLFAKQLALVFGSTSTATFTVLATFLGGMAVGSLLGGRLAAGVSRPLMIYAMVELAIGAFCILTPALFKGLQGLYVVMAADLPPDAPSLLALRISLGASVLLVPTVLMGITLPLLAQAMDPKGNHLGASVAWLYACNTGGAAVGALLTSYVIIPLLGGSSTTLIAALINFLVALAALELAKKLVISDKKSLPFTLTSLDLNSSEMLSRSNSKVLFAAWLALGVGGVLSLGLEVIYVHLLSIVAGNSVYAFGLMLATFLVGLSLGGEVGRRVIARADSNRGAWLAATQVALSVTVAIGAWGWDMIPAYFASFSGYPVLEAFRSREAIRGIVCALVMIPPTLCIGLSYTLAMDLATSATQRRGITVLGISAALNTLGNIIGVLLFGFLLLPCLGGLNSAKVVSVGTLLVAVVTIVSTVRRNIAWRLGCAVVAAFGLIAISPSQLNYGLLSSGANVYFTAQDWGSVVSHAESIDGGLTTVVAREIDNTSIKTLLTNGKFQGNNAHKGEVQPQIGFAALPLLHQDARDNALVIGYGTGATSRVFHDAGFSHLDIAELSRDVVTLANDHFADINSRVSALPGVTTHITDGRNFLLLTKRQYDIISIEITSIWFAGAASLYNQEFYQLARAKLNSHGVLQQWVQLHHMAPTDLLTIIGTLRSEFTYVSLYVVGGQGVLIATNDPAHARPLPSVITQLDHSERLKPIRDLAGRKFADIAEDLLLSPREIEVFLDQVGLGRALWLSTDNNLRLEYNTPKANGALSDQSFDVNMTLLRSAKGTAHSDGIN